MLAGFCKEIRCQETCAVCFLQRARPHCSESLVDDMSNAPFCVSFQQLVKQGQVRQIVQRSFRNKEKLDVMLVGMLLTWCLAAAGRSIGSGA
jgi:hypothetical protein